MSLAQVLFYVLAFIAVASALFVAASKNLVRGIFMFFVTLLALAGLYVLALADFVAITQIVIYVGGILVLILFAFMLSGKETLNAIQDQKTTWFNLSKLPALLLGIGFFVVTITMVLRLKADDLLWIKQATIGDEVMKPDGSDINNIGINLMTLYLLPLEAISVLLMMALIGAAHLSRKEPEA